MSDDNVINFPDQHRVDRVSADDLDRHDGRVRQVRDRDLSSVDDLDRFIRQAKRDRWVSTVANVRSLLKRPHDGVAYLWSSFVAWLFYTAATEAIDDMSANLRNSTGANGSAISKRADLVTKRSEVRRRRLFITVGSVTGSVLFVMFMVGEMKATFGPSWPVWLFYARPFPMFLVKLAGWFGVYFVLCWVGRDRSHSVITETVTLDRGPAVLTRTALAEAIKVCVRSMKDVEFPQVTGPTRIDGGEEAVVQMVPGGSFDEFVKARDQLAAALDTHDPAQIIVDRFPGRPALVRLVFLDQPIGERADLLDMAHPLLETPGQARAITDGSPVGRSLDPDGFGELVTVSMRRTSTAVGGKVQNGKTGAAQGLVMSALHDPDAMLIVVDPKGQDYAKVGPLASIWLTGTTPEFHDNVTAMFKFVVDAIKTRSALLLQPELEPFLSREDNVSPALLASEWGHRFPRIVICLEEFWATRKQSPNWDRVDSDLVDIILREGPAQGVTVAMTAHRFDTETFEGSMADLLGNRVGVRMDPTAGRLFYGSHVDQVTRKGEGYVWSEASDRHEPVRTRFFHITDEVLDRLIDSAWKVRRANPRRWVLGSRDVVICSDEPTVRETIPGADDIEAEAVEARAELVDRVVEAVDRQGWGQAPKLQFVEVVHALTETGLGDETIDDLKAMVAGLGGETVQVSSRRLTGESSRRAGFVTSILAQPHP